MKLLCIAAATLAELLMCAAAAPVFADGRRDGRRLYAVSGSGRVNHVLMDPLSIEQTGPTTYVDRFRWVEHVWRRLSPSMKDRLIRNLSKLKPSSAFSGMGGLELVVFLIIAFVRRLSGVDLAYDKCIEAGDAQPGRRAVLTATQPRHRPHHITKTHL